MRGSKASRTLAVAVLGASFCLAQSVNHHLTCESCHVEAKTQPGTDMAHAMENPETNPGLKAHPRLTYQLGIYRYTIETRDNQSTYSVTDGKDTVALPIHWIFGREMQTYVLGYQGQLYEGLVSFYPTINNLDITIGDESIRPASLEQAMGRLLTSHEVKACFGCHSTNSVANGTLQLDRMTPGISCEHCHSKNAEHLQAISQGKLTVIPPKLGHMSAEDMSSFCGQCHRTWQTVVQNRWIGPMNVRFQPYRLANSKCFDGVDQRISCVACHNPHRELVRDDKAYDAKCLACHSAGAKPSLGMIAEHPDRPAAAVTMKVCPRATQNCVTCHMPKVPLPGGHRVFRDHDIRVVSAGEKYPN